MVRLHWKQVNIRWNFRLHNWTVALQDDRRRCNPIGMSTTDLREVSILVVEDESLLRRQLAATLKQFGADVTTAETLAGARRCLREAQSDFVLLDVNLPDGLGTDLLGKKFFRLPRPSLS